MILNKWPDFFIAGAPKAGTTSMYMYLQNIPGIFLSKIKEPHYFALNTPSYPLLNHIRDKKEYLELFKKAKNEHAIGEASADYLRDPASPKLIHDTIPNTKFIFILRDPITRAFSHYLQNVRVGIETQSFFEALEKCLKIDSRKYPNKGPLYLDAGLYAEQLKRYLKYFDMNQMKILIFEEFIKNPKSSVEEVLDFLNVKSEVPDFAEEAYNPFRIPKNKLAKKILLNRTIGMIVKKSPIPESIVQSARIKYLEKKVPKPQMSENEKKLLERYYKSDVQRLKKLIGRELPWSFAS